MLPLATMRRYAYRVAECCSDLTAPEDRQIQTIISYYHTDHPLVEALLDPAHPRHSDCWSEWTQHVIRILVSKGALGETARSGSACLEDLQQEAMADLWHGLPAFRYRSRFQTWAFTVVSRSFSRSWRTLQAQKRSALPPAQSLEALICAGAESLPDLTVPPPDDAVLAATFIELLNQALKRHPDERLQTIFHLWAAEDRTLREIGAHLHLSVARVHTLLMQAHTFLRQTPAVVAWCEQAAPAPVKRSVAAGDAIDNPSSLP